MRTFKTEGGKTVQLYIKPNTQHVAIKFLEGGELPVELSGLYTSENAATRDIILFLDKKVTKTTSRKAA